MLRWYGYLKTFLLSDKDLPILLCKGSTMIADGLATQGLGHQQPWYWPSYSRTFQFQHQKWWCYYHQIGSIHLSHCYHIFLWLCAWDVCYIMFCHLFDIRSGKTGNLFSLLLRSLWWVQIFGYVLACRSYSFVCTVHLLIIIIVQTYLKALNL